ncbi:hypothetical protein [Roseibium sp.]|uniref:hypothetical protein n=1 Tax=Roseibium sp. TaxID=1936156 RepID=UPI003265A42E
MASRRPLQNRVLPTAEIVAITPRGTMMGNRGGRIHDPDTRMLLQRKWASRRWICCVTSFKGRRRKVMGQSYTELFFLDEVTALAAGHRPCFECRRADAKQFASTFALGTGCTNARSADEIDRILHSDRLEGRQQKTYQSPLGELPNGAMVLFAGQPHAIYRGALLSWQPEGYALTTETTSRDTMLTVLTPKCVVQTLRAGYQPVWHPSASDKNFKISNR